MASNAPAVTVRINHIVIDEDRCWGERVCPFLATSCDGCGQTRKTYCVHPDAPSEAIPEGAHPAWCPLNRGIVFVTKLFDGYELG